MPVTPDTPLCLCGVSGDCNIMKYTHSEELFLAHTRAVALHNVGVDEWPGDVADDEEGEEEAEQEGGEEQVQQEESTTAEASADQNPFAAFAFGARAVECDAPRPAPSQTR